MYLPASTCCHMGSDVDRYGAQLYLLVGDAISQFQDADHPTREPPDFGLVVPTPSSSAHDSLQRLLIRSDPDSDEMVRSWADGGLLDEQFDGGVSKLALVVGSMSDADQYVAKLPGQLECAAAFWGQLFGDAQAAGGLGLCLHNVRSA